jgi:hypothetical protein
MAVATASNSAATKRIAREEVCGLLKMRFSRAAAASGAGGAGGAAGAARRRGAPAPLTVAPSWLHPRGCAAVVATNAVFVV